MGRVTSNGNEAKSNMKHPLDIPTPSSNSSVSDLWSNALPTRSRRRPSSVIKKAPEQNNKIWMIHQGTAYKVVRHRIAHQSPPHTHTHMHPITYITRDKISDLFRSRFFITPILENISLL